LLFVLLIIPKQGKMKTGMISFKNKKKQTIMTNVLNSFVEMQTKTMETVLENAKNMPQSLTNFFGNPSEMFKTTWMNTENAKAMYENNKKFHNAYINYNKAVAEMYEAVFANVELINKETVKAN
jgi:hypothetical protein